MSAARGIADLGSATPLDDGTLYRAVEEIGHFIGVPSRLEIAAREDAGGEPDLSLELVRGQSPFRPPAPYGVLDLRVAAPPLGPGALEIARTLDPAAFLTPAAFEEGYLRLQVVAGRDAVGDGLLEEIERPVWVASNGLDSARIVRRLTPEGALLLRDALVDGAVTTTAVAEMTLRGLAERVPVTLTFERAALLDVLAAQADQQSRISVDAIVALWMREDGVPLAKATGLEDVERSRLARILADWTIATLASPVACGTDPIVPTVRLSGAPSTDGALTWDLMRGRTTTRIVVMRLDPFAVARQLIAAGGLDRFWQETIVPPIDTGVVHIDVDTNLPHPIRGIARAGVQLRAAPHPPERVHELSDALLFDERGEPQRIEWRMSPNEPLRYEYSCFALLRQGATTRRVEGPPKPSDERRLLIGVDDLPVDLVAVGAGEDLLDGATVRGACARQPLDAGVPERVEFQLTAQQPRVAVGLSRGSAEQFGLEIEACPLDGASCVTLGPLPARSTKLAVSSFVQFGPQVVDISVDFDVDVALVALDLLAERDDGDPASATVLSFTPAAPTRRWQYLNPTPFRSGYRYRFHDGGEDAWSEVQPAGRALSVRASAPASQARAASAPNDAAEGFEFEDLYCYRDDEPGSYFVIPLVPGPELDGAGRPMLMTIPLGERGLLQLGLHLGPDDDAVERLRVEIARRLGLEEGVLRLQVAPIEVRSAILLVAGTDGAVHELARRASSNFPPFTAIFNEQLGPEQLAAAHAATAGQSGRLLARYDARVQQRVTVSAVVRGDIAAIVARTAAAGADPERVAAAAIDDAMLDGSLRLDSDAPADAPASLRARVRARVVEELLGLVLRLSRSPGALPVTQAPTELHVTYSEPSWRALSPTIDIASWFAPRSPLQPTPT